ncbi:hypothetical protein VN97_g4732 [Penicillium thymicola]|uniref:Uncharacterized protein n=1 Tax=Penicillium thymicola TaxID=293382 RepID=A0AAI9X9M1_PENTH|nr:hypothetical protein VN97_g4732 [Penicillium thymicola]
MYKIIFLRYSVGKYHINIRAQSINLYRDIGLRYLCLRDLWFYPKLSTHNISLENNFKITDVYGRLNRPSGA